ncbi:hypothetical protein PSPO01_09985 [Paraphaeosphaeria sporulosa]
MTVHDRDAITTKNAATSDCEQYNLPSQPGNPAVDDHQTMAINRTITLQATEHIGDPLPMKPDDTYSIRADNENVTIQSGGTFHFLDLPAKLRNRI